MGYFITPAGRGFNPGEVSPLLHKVPFVVPGLGESTLAKMEKLMETDPGILNHFDAGKTPLTLAKLIALKKMMMDQENQEGEDPPHAPD